VLDVGCGRGALLLSAARRLSRPDHHAHSNMEAILLFVDQKRFAIMNVAERATMNLAETYGIVSQSIVAISLKLLPTMSAPPDVPEIIGTGFVVEEGLIATNDHVVRIGAKVPNFPGKVESDWPIEATLFHLTPDQGMVMISMRVLGAFTVETFHVPGAYYGPKSPDIGFLHVDMRGLPRLEIAQDEETVKPGVKVATTGFPMGTDALKAPGYVHQLTPTLQEGIVSAVLPFPCKTPHAFMLNMMTQGGASGSPIFLHDSPKVIGVVYAGLTEKYRTKFQGLSLEYPVPTNFTYCVPAHYLRTALDNIRSKPELALPPDSPVLAEALKHCLQKG